MPVVDGPLPIGDITLGILFVIDLTLAKNAINNIQEQQEKKENLEAKSNGNNKAGASAGVPSPDPDDDKEKSSRNKPKQKGEPNSTEVEKNPDGSIKRITQFDEKGNFQKEISPNIKGQHGTEGPTTKVPKYNTDPSGNVHMNGYEVRPATVEEIN